MPLTCWPVVAVAAVLSHAVAEGEFSSHTVVGDFERVEMSGHDGDSPDEAILVFGSRTVRVTRKDVQAMAAALAETVQSPNLAGRSRIPKTLARELPLSLGDAWIATTGEVRAGEWQLVGDEAGAHWEYRKSPPAPPQIGLLFLAPLVHTEQGWSIPQIIFQRVR